MVGANLDASTNPSSGSVVRAWWLGDYQHLTYERTPLMLPSMERDSGSDRRPQQRRNVRMPHTTAYHGKLWRYALLIVILLVCLWIGWRDLDPWPSQTEIREGIRAAIRSAVQVLVQFVVPAAILGYFGMELAARFRAPQATPYDDH